MPVIKSGDSLGSALRILGFFVLVAVLISSQLTMAEEHKELKAVLKGNGEFTKILYKQLATKQGNVFFSPISIHAILSLASQGAAGITKEAFSKVLNVPDIQVSAAGYKNVMERLNSVEDVTLLIANKVFLKDSYKLQAGFNSLVTESFYSEVQSIDFAKAVDAAKTINTWVEDKTNNKIKDLINSNDLNQYTRLVLVNAIYFKGKWAEPFDVRNTVTEKFYVNENESINVQMMRLTKKFFYKFDENLNAQVLELPYSNKDISLIVILPAEKTGIAELEAKLAETDLTKITEGMFRPEVQVSLPKFKIEQTIDLKDSLSAIGLSNIFDESANFSGMLESPEQLYVSKVVQKAFIEVNEEGAEAAAATGMTILLFSTAEEYPEFYADHPFIIILQNKINELTTILFKGRVSKPVYKEPCKLKMGTALSEVPCSHV